jgi:hypothetical protein
MYFFRDCCANEEGAKWVSEYPTWWLQDAGLGGVRSFGTLEAKWYVTCSFGRSAENWTIALMRHFSSLEPSMSLDSLKAS